MPAASISICRGREPFMLEPRDPVLYFVQRLRDEAHRFAIGTHRAKRSKAITAKPLDEIAGIGPRASARCSSISARPRRISRAGVEDLQRSTASAPQWPRPSMNISRAEPASPLQGAICTATPAVSFRLRGCKPTLGVPRPSAPGQVQTSEPAKY